MAPDEDTELAVAEFVEYCRTQAGLLAGKVETIGDEIDDLLAEIDRELADLRGRLDGHGEDAAGTPSPQSPETAASDDVDLDTIEAAEAELERKQAMVEAEQARLAAHQDLAADYSDLATELEANVEDPEEALERVVRFEAERDAPAYFPDRQTMVEAATDDGDTASNSG